MTHENETKSLSLSEVKMMGGNDAGYTFEGYCSVFNELEGDAYGDIIASTAYDATLKSIEEGGDYPLLLAQHKHSGLPIGKITKLEKDDYGLKMTAELTKGMSESEDYRAAIGHGTIRGLSIGYQLKGDDYEELERGGRLIKSMTLKEVSIVTFAAQASAKVDLLSVKSELETVETVRDAENLLRDKLNVSREAAKAISSMYKSVLQGEFELKAKQDAEAEAEKREIAILLALKAK